MTEKVLERVDDESLRVMLAGYVGLVGQTQTQFKLQLAAAVLSVDGDGGLGVPLLDLAYVTFPFLYNFRDACSLAAPQ